MNINTNNSRRNFLKKLGVIGVASVFIPHNTVNSMSLSQTNGTNDTKTDGFTFLFQGDSITDGNRGRNMDPNHIMGHGYAFSIASRLGANFPQKNLHSFNRGISGNKVTDLEQRWQKDCLDLKPNVLSILIGINDVSYYITSKGSAVADIYEETYKSLLNHTKAQNPDVLFVLCLPFILPVGNIKDNWEQYQLEIQKRQETVKRIATTYNALVVDFQQVMTHACQKAPADYWMWDGVHPTVAGHELLTCEWIKVVGKRLKFMRKI